MLVSNMPFASEGASVCHDRSSAATGDLTRCNSFTILEQTRDHVKVNTFSSLPYPLEILESCVPPPKIRGSLNTAHVAMRSTVRTIHLRGLGSASHIRALTSD
jgi:hypothetical protein